MNFIVQSLIIDLENMGRFPREVKASEWQDKWTALSQLSAEEYAAVEKGCEGNAYGKKAWDLVKSHDPDPQKTERKNAMQELFKF